MNSALNAALAIFIAVSLAACGGGSGGSGATVTSPAINVSSSGSSTPTVVMNAATDISDTGGDDLAAARGMFRSAGYPESNGGLESSAALLSGINVRAIRIIDAKADRRSMRAATSCPAIACRGTCHGVG